MLFKDIIGHQAAKEKLIGSAEKGWISHAQLFFGKPGSVPFSLALAYAQYVSCLSPQATDSCGVCAHCKQFASGNFPDLHYAFPVTKTEDSSNKPISDEFLTLWRQYLEKCAGIPHLNDWLTFMGAGNVQGKMTVHESASLAKKLSLKSYTGGTKIFLVWLPELFVPQAANKLLKNIEEPEGDTLILLVSENPDGVLQTLRSRCQKMQVPLYKSKEVEQWLTAHGVAGTVAGPTSALAEGNLHEALRIAQDSASFHEYAVLFRDWMRACLKVRVKDIFSFVDTLSSKRRESIKEALSLYIHTIEISLKSNVTSHKIDHLLYKKASFDLNKFAPFVHSGNAGRIHKLLSEAYRDISRNGNPKIILSDCSFKMTRFLHLKP
jgi:DNA polymerase-3 subunit delta'